MPIIEKFVIETTPGIEPILFSEWLAQLPVDEQQRYNDARARMDAYRQEAIDSGRMIHVHGASPGEYIWRDEAAKKQGKQSDNECLSFYDRFNAETGRKLVIIVEHVDETDLKK